MEGEISKATHVYLVDDSDNLHYLWLPGKIEGRYSFDIVSKGKSYQIIIDADGDSWEVDCGSDGDFIVGIENIGNEIHLRNNTLYQVKYDTAEFVLYSQQVTDGDNLYSPYFVYKFSNAIINIGRLEGNEFVYAYPSVSRYHAQLRDYQNS